MAAASSSTAAATAAAAILPGEKVQMRMVGSAPVMVAESRQLSIVLDPSGAAPGNAVLNVRHGARSMLTVGDSGDGGVDLSVGGLDGSSNELVYMSFKTPSHEGAVERVRLSQAAMDVSVDGAFERNLTVYGCFNAASYINLVDSYASTSLVQPPTANALSSAYRALSNMVVTYTNGMNPGSNTPTDIVLPEGFDPSAADAMVTGSLLCTNMFVSPNGSLTASSFCNLVQDFSLTSLSMPPSANALNTAYLQLSNMVVSKIRSATHSLARSNVTFEVPANSFQSDMWIVSEPDDANRMLFPSAPDLPALFEAGPGSLPGALAFVWRASGSNAMSLTRGGELFAQGGIVVPSGGVRVQSGGIDVQSGGMRVGAGGVTAAGDLRLTSGSVVVDSGSVVLSDGYVSAASYCNLPVASGSSTGVVRLTDAADPALSNAAATGAALAASFESANRRTDMLQSYVSDALYALYLASNAAASASNISCARTWVRAFDEPSVINAVALTNASSNPSAGVRMLFGVGVGGESSALRSNLSADPGYEADPTGSNCASISIVSGPSVLGSGAKELVVAGAPPLQSTPGVPPPCEVAVGASVQVRAGAAASQLPVDNANAATFSDSASGSTFTFSASSVFSPDDFWDQPYVVASSAESSLAWISGIGTYVGSTGYPSGSAAQTQYAQGSGAVSGVSGEWIQIDVSPGAFVTRFTVTASDSWVPDDFVLLACVDTSGTRPWTIMASMTAQGGALASAGTTGIQYSVDAAAAAEALRMGSFRLVVTRIAVPGQLTITESSQAVVKLRGFRLYGSTSYPLPSTLLTVDHSTLVVDRSGHVGINNADPLFPLHIGGLGTVAASRTSPTSAFPAVVALGDRAGHFRGIGLTSNAMVLATEANADHTVVSGQREIATFHGSDASLSNAGCCSVGLSLSVASNVNVGGDLAVGRVLSVQGQASFDSSVSFSDTTVMYGQTVLSNSTTSYGPTWLCDSVVVSSPAAPILQAGAYPLTVQASSPMPGLDPVSIYATGAVYSGGDVYSYSDRRVKEDVTRIDRALERVREIGGYTYSRVDMGGRGTGVIAQEVERVLPEAVRRDVGGNLHVAYGNLVGLLVEAVRELSDRQADMSERLAFVADACVKSSL